ncbi:hypothetical protein PMIN07_005482 [Paraphaeosphaeria minitans]
MLCETPASQTVLAHALRSPPKLCPACACLLFEYLVFQFARDPAAQQRVHDLHPPNHLTGTFYSSHLARGPIDHIKPFSDQDPTAATFQNMHAVFHGYAANPTPL